MSDQQYVYTTYETTEQHLAGSELESVINEYASQGWRISETVERDGTTVALLFERRV